MSDRAGAGQPRGFITVVEMIIVIAVCGLLTSVAYPLYRENREREAWTTARASLIKAQSALADYAGKARDRKFPLLPTGAGPPVLRKEVPDMVPPAFPGKGGLSDLYYESDEDASTYTLLATVANRHADTLRLTPTSLTPRKYPRGGN